MSDAPTLPSVRSFASLGDYLGALLESRRRANPRYSYAVLARSFEGVSPSLLRMIVKGRRSPNPAVLDGLAKLGNWSELERDYAQLLDQFARARSTETKRRLAGKLEELREVAEAKGRYLDLESFSVMSSWYGFTLVEMTKLADAGVDAEWYQERLGGGVSLREVKAMLGRLEKLEVLERDESGRYRTRNRSYLTGYKAPSECIRQFHHEMIRKAEAAIEAQSPAERIVSGMTLAISADKLALVQQEIYRSLKRIAKIAETPSGEEVYQCNVQFFRLTEPASRTEKVSVGARAPRVSATLPPPVFELARTKELSP